MSKETSVRERGQVIGINYNPFVCSLSAIISATDKPVALAMASMLNSPSDNKCITVSKKNHIGSKQSQPGKLLNNCSAFLLRLRYRLKLFTSFRWNFKNFALLT